MVSNHMFSGARNSLRPFMIPSSDYIIQKSKMADVTSTDFRYIAITSIETISCAHIISHLKEIKDENIIFKYTISITVQ